MGELIEKLTKEIDEKVENLAEKAEGEIEKIAGELSDDEKREIKESLMENEVTKMWENTERYMNELIGNAKRKIKENIDRKEELERKLEREKGKSTGELFRETKKEMKKNEKRMMETSLMKKVSELIKPYLEIKTDSRRDTKEWIGEKAKELDMDPDELEKKLGARIRMSIGLDRGEMHQFSWDNYQNKPGIGKIYEGLHSLGVCSFEDISRGLELVRELRDQDLDDKKIEDAVKGAPKALIRLNDSTYLVPREYDSQVRGIFENFTDTVKSLYTDNDPEINPIKAESRGDFIRRTSEEWRIC